jgi:uridine kinase
MGRHIVNGEQKFGRAYRDTCLTGRLQDSFYKPLNPEQSVKAFQNEYDFDSPEAIDFDALVQSLKDLKAGCAA